MAVAPAELGADLVEHGDGPFGQRDAVVVVDGFVTVVGSAFQAAVELVGSGEFWGFRPLSRLLPAHPVKPIPLPSIELLVIDQ